MYGLQPRTLPEIIARIVRVEYGISLIKLHPLVHVLQRSYTITKSKSKSTEGSTAHRKHLDANKLKILSARSWM